MPSLASFAATVRFRCEPPIWEGSPGDREDPEPGRDFKKRLATGAGVETFATLLPGTFDFQS
jgi:hypothetical protein